MDNLNASTMQTRAKALARAAIAAMDMPAHFADTDYGRARADYERRRIENRQAGIARRDAHNHELRVQAAIRRHGGYQLDMFN